MPLFFLSWGSQFSASLSGGGYRRPLRPTWLSGLICLWSRGSPRSSHSLPPVDKIKAEVVLFKATMMLQRTRQKRNTISSVGSRNRLFRPLCSPPRSRRPVVAALKKNIRKGARIFRGNYAFGYFSIKTGATDFSVAPGVRLALCSSEHMNLL